MKKIIKLTERDLTRLVKRVIKENNFNEGKLKNFIFKKINNLVEGGLYLEPDNNDEYILFKNNNNDEVIFRYLMDSGDIRYNDDIFYTVYYMFGKEWWTIIPNAHEVLNNIVREWIEEYFVDEYSEEIEDISGYEFEIGVVSNDEGFNSKSGEHDDEYYD